MLRTKLTIHIHLIFIRLQVLHGLPSTLFFSLKLWVSIGDGESMSITSAISTAAEKAEKTCVYYLYILTCSSPIPLGLDLWLEFNQNFLNCCNSFLGKRFSVIWEHCREKLVTLMAFAGSKIFMKHLLP